MPFPSAAFSSLRPEGDGVTASIEPGSGPGSSHFFFSWNSARRFFSSTLPRKLSVRQPLDGLFASFPPLSPSASTASSGSASGSPFELSSASASAGRSETVSGSAPSTASTGDDELVSRQSSNKKTGRRGYDTGGACFGGDGSPWPTVSGRNTRNTYSNSNGGNGARNGGAPMVDVAINTTRLADLLSDDNRSWLRVGLESPSSSSLLSSGREGSKSESGYGGEGEVEMVSVDSASSAYPTDDEDEPPSPMQTPSPDRRKTRAFFVKHQAGVPVACPYGSIDRLKAQVVAHLRLHCRTRFGDGEDGGNDRIGRGDNPGVGMGVDVDDGQGNVGPFDDCPTVPLLAMEAPFGTVADCRDYEDGDGDYAGLPIPFGLAELDGREDGGCLDGSNCRNGYRVNRVLVRSPASAFAEIHFEPRDPLRPESDDEDEDGSVAHAGRTRCCIDGAVFADSRTGSGVVPDLESQNKETMRRLARRTDGLRGKLARAVGYRDLRAVTSAGSVGQSGREHKKVCGRSSPSTLRTRLVGLHLRDRARMTMSMRADGLVRSRSPPPAPPPTPARSSIFSASSMGTITIKRGQASGGSGWTSSSQTGQTGSFGVGRPLSCSSLPLPLVPVPVTQTRPERVLLLNPFCSQEVNEPVEPAVCVEPVVEKTDGPMPRLRRYASGIPFARDFAASVRLAGIGSGTVKPTDRKGWRMGLHSGNAGQNDGFRIDRTTSSTRLTGGLGGGIMPVKRFSLPHLPMLAHC